MSLDIHRTHLIGLDLTNKEIDELIETITGIITKVVDNLFMELDKHESHQQ